MKNDRRHQPPELLTRKQVALLLGVSPPQIYRWHERGLIPAPFQLSKDSALLWRRRELLDWIDAGLPDRDRWQLLAWRPSVSMRLAQYIELQKREAAATMERVKELMELLKEGEDVVRVVRGDR